jgi:hypothetical protein
MIIDLLFLACLFLRAHGCSSGPEHFGSPYNRSLAIEDRARQYGTILFHPDFSFCGRLPLDSCQAQTKRQTQEAGELQRLQTPGQDEQKQVRYG